MARTCPDCIFYGALDATCRRQSPRPEMATGNAQIIWPAVTAEDWCAEGYNPQEGWYDASPSQSSPSSVQKVVRPPGVR